MKESLIRFYFPHNVLDESFFSVDKNFNDAKSDKIPLTLFIHLRPTISWNESKMHHLSHSCSLTHTHTLSTNIPTPTHTHTRTYIHTHSLSYLPLSMSKAFFTLTIFLAVPSIPLCPHPHALFSFIILLSHNTHSLSSSHAPSLF